jgi:hypothetical protein
MEAVVQLGKSISGDALSVVPVHLSNYHATKGPTYRTPEPLKAHEVDLADFEKFERQDKKPIGTHAQLDFGMSGLCSFFILQDLLFDHDPSKQLLRIKEQEGRRVTSDTTNMARLEYTLTDERIRETMLRSIEDVLEDFGITIVYDSFLKLMVSFHDKCFPGSHSDAGKNVEPNQFRMLWDFHPRGRIISFPDDPYGLFLENCGVHICSKVMCGNLGYTTRTVLGDKLMHQGWDNRTDRGDCALLTAIIDFTVDTCNPMKELGLKKVVDKGAMEERLFFVASHPSFQQRMTERVEELLKVAMTKLIAAGVTETELKKKFTL